MAKSPRKRRRTDAAPLRNDDRFLDLVERLHLPLPPRLVRILALAVSIAGVAFALLFWRRDAGVDVARAAPRELARAARERPGDWRLMRDLTAVSLDLTVPDRKTLWLRSYVAARELTDGWDPAARDLVRSGLFHWPELTAEERATVLAAARRLMRDPQFFDRNLKPFWSLTRSVRYLETARPPGSEPLARIAKLAANHGDFDSYRRVRETLAREREQELLTLIDSGASTNEVLPILLDVPVDHRNRRALIRALTALAQRPPAMIGIDEGRVGEFVRNILDHGLPVDGFLPLADSGLPAPLRARIALRAGDRPLADRIEREAGFTGTAEWTEYHVDRIAFDRAQRDTAAASSRLRNIHPGDRAHPAVVALGGSPGEEPPRRLAHGLCANEVICSDRAVVTLFADGRRPHVLELAAATDAAGPPYVETYVDGKLVAEFAVPGEPVSLNLTAGLHRIEVRLANPTSPSGAPRRVSMRIR